MHEKPTKGHGLPASEPVAFPFSRPQCRSLARRLSGWFQRHARDLPWRRGRDPYAIWVSEIMLQQTQVAAVIPYFERFLKSFPTVADLADASEQEVLRLWEGLGYYRRARALHQAAKALARDHDGRIPDDPEAFGALPGIGRYTLGAVLSQAFDRRLPILEANSIRVLTRLLGEREDPRSSAVQKRLWAAAETLLPRSGAGEFNQALMELGALLCTPKSPDCAACPLRDWCAAARAGLQDRIPPPARPKEIETVEEIAVVVRRGDTVLLVRRPPTAPRWADMWEFPHGESTHGEDHGDSGRRLLAELTGIEAELGPRLLTIRHGVTRFRITLNCFEARHRRGEFDSTFYDQGLWLRPEELHSYPVSTPQRRLARALLK